MIRDALRDFALQQGWLAHRTASAEDVGAFIASFREHYVNVDLIRVGGDGDGSYLLPDDFEGIEACFSPGVDDKAHFEDWLATQHGIKSFMADASVDALPFENPLFKFDKKYLGALTRDDFTTLTDWVEAKVGQGHDKDMLLQMDIERFEFDVLIETSTELLKKFRYIVIEFHDMHQLFETHSLRLLRSVFDKLYQHFSIAHAHPNNYRKIYSSGGHSIPRLFEVTFIRNDRVPLVKNNEGVSLPHPLDIHNVPDMEQIHMPPEWWRS